MSPAAPSGATPVEVLTSPAGALSLATVALLLVLGLRLARPRGGAGWAGAGAYAAALVATLLGGLGLLSGSTPPAPLAARLAGVAAIVAGLLLAAAARRRADAAGAEGARTGPPQDARTRLAQNPRTAPLGPSSSKPAAAPSAGGAPPLVHLGLVLVLAGQVLRAPSTAGAVTVAAAALAHAVAARAWSGARARR